MSSSGPFGNEGDDNPFGGMGFIGDIAKMLQQQGSASWDAARNLAMSVATDGASEPNVDPGVRIQLEELARVAELQVTDTTGLSTSGGGSALRVTAVTRSAWTLQTLDAYKPHFENLSATLRTQENPAAGPEDFDAGDPMGFLGPLMELIGPMMLGMAAGSMVGHLAQRSFGPYGLPIPRSGDDIGIIIGNVDRFGEEWSLPQDDLRLWICIHEVAHHSVLRIPHVRTRLEKYLHDYLSGFSNDATSLESRLADFDPGSGMGLESLQQAFGDPEVLLGAIQSPEQLALLPRVEALVAVIVGYVDHVLDTVGGRLLSNYGLVTEALRRRRVESDQSNRFVERLFGLELSQTTYDRGQAFVEGVVERSGTEGLARLWAGDRELPTPNEVDAPGLWLARIDLPS